MSDSKAISITDGEAEYYSSSQKFTAWTKAADALYSQLQSTREMLGRHLGTITNEIAHVEKMLAAIEASRGTQ